jgi:hypothetical protein
MSDEKMENAFAKLVDVIRPFFDDYPRNSDARNLISILAPPPSRDPNMFAIVKQSVEGLLRSLDGKPEFEDLRERIERAWEEVLREVLR